MNKEYSMKIKKTWASEASDTILTNLPLLICGMMVALAIVHDLSV